METGPTRAVVMLAHNGSAKIWTCRRIGPAFTFCNMRSAHITFSETQSVHIQLNIMMINRISERSLRSNVCEKGEIEKFAHLIWLAIKTNSIVA